MVPFILPLQSTLLKYLKRSSTWALFPRDDISSFPIIEKRGKRLMYSRQMYSMHSLQQCGFLMGMLSSSSSGIFSSIIFLNSLKNGEPLLIPSAAPMLSSSIQKNYLLYLQITRENMFIPKSYMYAPSKERKRRQYCTVLRLTIVYEMQQIIERSPHYGKY